MPKKNPLAHINAAEIFVQFFTRINAISPFLKMASGRKGQSSGLKMKFWELLSGSKVPSWWDPCKFFVTYDMLDVLFDHCSKFDGTMDNLLRSSLTLLDFQYWQYWYCCCCQLSCLCSMYGITKSILISIIESESPNFVIPDLFLFSKGIACLFSLDRIILLNKPKLSLKYLRHLFCF